MAKRVRGQRSTHRPGGVGPARPDRDPAPPRATGPSGPVPSAAAAPAAPAAPAEAAPIAIASSTTVVTTSARSATATRELRQRTKLRSSGLDQKAAAEAGWVTDDLRRIAVISAIMVAGLAIAWVLLVVVGLGAIY